jgi:hypothetical protein
MEGASRSIASQIDCNYGGISKSHGEKDQQSASGLVE